MPIWLSATCAMIIHISDVLYIAFRSRSHSFTLTLQLSFCLSLSDLSVPSFDGSLVLPLVVVVPCPPPSYGRATSC